MPTRPEQHRLILNVAAAQHELETVAILMESVHRAAMAGVWDEGSLDGQWNYEHAAMIERGLREPIPNPYEEDCA